MKSFIFRRAISGSNRRKKEGSNWDIGTSKKPAASWKYDSSPTCHGVWWLGRKELNSFLGLVVSLDSWGVSRGVKLCWRTAWCLGWRRGAPSWDSHWKRPGANAVVGNERVCASLWRDVVGEERHRLLSQGMEESLLFSASRLGSPGKCGACSFSVVVRIWHMRALLKGEVFKRPSDDVNW